MTRFAFDATRGKKDEDYTTKHDTPEQLVKELLAFIPIAENDTCLDAGSGKNKVWFNNFPSAHKDEVEIEEGKDFLKYDKQVDWVIGNPPYNQLLLFLFKSAEISKKGFAFLINHSRLNQLTPVRLNKLADKGFFLSAIHICSVKSWFGRYYFIVFTGTKSDNITWQ